VTSNFRAFLFLALLSGIIIFLGGLMGGRTGVIIALGLALVMNAGSYWYSDRIVLSMYRARELEAYEAPALHRMVEELARTAGIPKPRICVIPEEAPNAFATGRDPQHGVVAVTEGIMRLLSPEELNGVLAHEIGHIANRDILIQTVAGVMASAIVSIANIMQFTALFGGGRGDGEGGGSGNVLAALLMAMLAPLAAALIRMALSRSREYLADETGAAVSGRPLALAGALAKLQAANQRLPMRRGNPSTENMFIVSPFSGASFASLFSTHPPVEERIARLKALAGGR
jgi:heat shock protein HtpX